MREGVEVTPSKNIEVIPDSVKISEHSSPEQTLAEMNAQETLVLGYGSGEATSLDSKHCDGTEQQCSEPWTELTSPQPVLLLRVLCADTSKQKSK